MSDQRPQTEAELVDYVRSLDVPAPPSLHARIEQLAAEHARGGGSVPLAARLRARPAALGGALALAAVVVAVLVVSLAGGGSSTSLNWRAASALTQRAATSSAPAGRGGAELAASVGGVAFPSWERSFGWRATGVRSDVLDGRQVTTVFYANARGQRIGYAIAAGSAPGVSGGTVFWREGTPYRLLSAEGVRAVVWQRGGHMCVLAGRGVSSATLLRLASWSDGALSS